MRIRIIWEGKTKEAHLRRNYVNLLNSEALQGQVKVEPHDVLVLTEQV